MTYDSSIQYFKFQIPFQSDVLITKYIFPIFENILKVIRYKKLNYIVLFISYELISTGFTRLVSRNIQFLRKLHIFFSHH